MREKEWSEITYFTRFVCVVSLYVRLYIVGDVCDLCDLFVFLCLSSIQSTNLDIIGFKLLFTEIRLSVYFTA